MINKKTIFIFTFFILSFAFFLQPTTTFALSCTGAETCNLANTADVCVDGIVEDCSGPNPTCKSNGMWIGNCGDPAASGCSLGSQCVNGNPSPAVVSYSCINNSCLEVYDGSGTTDPQCSSSPGCTPSSDLFSCNSNGQCVKDSHGTPDASCGGACLRAVISDEPGGGGGGSCACTVGSECIPQSEAARCASGGGIEVCGDNRVGGSEACDHGSANGACPADCSSSCTINSCGNAGNPSCNLPSSPYYSANPADAITYANYLDSGCYKSNTKIDNRCVSGNTWRVEGNNANSPAGLGVCKGGNVNLGMWVGNTVQDPGGGFGDLFYDDTYCEQRYSCTIDNGVSTNNGTKFTLTTITTTGGKIKTVGNNDIDCGTDCSQKYDKDTNVTLSATPNSSYWRFVGWAGDCSSIGFCSLIMDAAKTVTAIFSPRQFLYKEF
ncbi:MAG: hypothetical protein ABL899_03345 [Nitrospira sp.]